MSNINHPEHYNQGEIECIDAMISAKGIEKVKAFCECNSFKYEWRLGDKDAPEQEVGKIQWYLNKFNELWAKTKQYFYPKNKHTYYYLQTIKMKNSTTGDWEEAVLYTDRKGVYAREIVDFYSKFISTESKGDA